MTDAFVDYLDAQGVIQKLASDERTQGADQVDYQKVLLWDKTANRGVVVSTDGELSIIGTVAISGGTLAVTGPLTDAQLRAAQVAVVDAAAGSSLTSIYNAAQAYHASSLTNQETYSDLAHDDIVALQALLPLALDVDGGLKAHVTNPGLTDTQLRATALPLPSGAATQTTLQSALDALVARFGEKSWVAQRVTASGDTTLITPAAGKRIAVYWVAIQPDPALSTYPRVRLTFGAGGTVFYDTFALGHWGIRTGAADQLVIVNLDAAASVGVNIEYLEIT